MDQPKHPFDCDTTIPLQVRLYARALGSRSPQDGQDPDVVHAQNRVVRDLPLLKANVQLAVALAALDPKVAAHVCIHALSSECRTPLVEACLRELAWRERPLPEPEAFLAAWDRHLDSNTKRQMVAAIMICQWRTVDLQAARDAFHQGLQGRARSQAVVSWIAGPGILHYDMDDHMPDLLAILAPTIAGLDPCTEVVAICQQLLNRPRLLLALFAGGMPIPDPPPYARPEVFALRRRWTTGHGRTEHAWWRGRIAEAFAIEDSRLAAMFPKA